MKLMSSDELLEWMQVFANGVGRQPPGFWYLASPYSKYPQGTAAAFEEVCKAAAWCIQHGIFIHCPIAESHPIALHGGMDSMDHDFWLDNDLLKIEAAVGMIVCKMETWEESTGLLWERDQFRDAGKPVVYLEWPGGQLIRE